MGATDNPAKGIAWDLSDLYSSIDDPQIKIDQRKSEELTKQFIKKYKWKINTKGLTAEFYLQAIKDDEELSELVHKFSYYASLLHEKDANSEKIGKFFAQCQEFTTKLSTQLTWFGIEWKDLPDEIADRIIADPLLKGYKHSLRQSRIFKPFIKSEAEEILMEKLDQTGSSAFVRFYDEMIASLRFKLKVDGKTQELTNSQLGPYLSTHPDRNVRKQATIALIDSLEKVKKNYTFILNNLLLDKKISDEIRGYKYAQQATFLSYEVEKPTVENMAEEIRNNYNISERFYKAKKKMLGYPELNVWDAYCRIYPEIDKRYTWEEAKSIVLEAFREFSTEFADIAQKFFDSKWIDAELSEGKTHGAFCAGGTPKTHPHILVNFTGRIDDISTLAHELGHGIHDYLSRKQTAAEYHASIAVCEIASVFAENLVFEKLYKGIKDKKLKTNLLVNKIQDSIATVFVQNAYYLFEVEANKFRRENGELGVEDFNTLFSRYMQEIYGKSLKFDKYTKYRWMRISHFYQFNFYVFTYCMGELLTNSLYAIYSKDNSKDFIKNYIEALSAGGSLSPYEITKIMGVDIREKDFWKKGLEILDGYVKEFEKLTK